MLLREQPQSIILPVPHHTHVKLANNFYFSHSDGSCCCCPADDTFINHGRYIVCCWVSDIYAVAAYQNKIYRWRRGRRWCVAWRNFCAPSPFRRWMENERMGKLTMAIRYFSPTDLILILVFSIVAIQTVIMRWKPEFWRITNCSEWTKLDLMVYSQYYKMQCKNPRFPFLLSGQ